MALPPALDPRRRRHRGAPPAAPSGNQFKCRAVHFDGTVMLESAGYGSTEAGDSGTLVLMYRPADLEDLQHFLSLANSALDVAFSGPDAFSADMNAGEGGEGSFSFDASYELEEGAFYPVLMSWGTDKAAGQKTYSVYIGDAPAVDQGTTDADAAFDIAYDASTYRIGGLGSFPDLLGDVAEYFFMPGVEMDFSVVENRRKFFDAAGKPVDPGTDGSLPFGAIPLIYLSVREGELATAILENRGAGASFTKAGAGNLALADGSPSD